MSVPEFRRYINIVENKFSPPKDDTYESAVEIAVEMFNDARHHTNPGEWDDLIYELSMHYNISEEDIRSNANLEEAKKSSDDLERQRQADPKLSDKPKVAYADPTSDTKINFDNPTSKGSLSTNNPEKKLPGKVKSKRQSRASMTDVNLPRGSGNVMRDFMNQTADITDPVDVPNPEDHDVDYVDVGRPEPKTPGTDVATISKALANIEDDVELNWHELRNLPGYAIEQIRGAFRPLFNEFMDAQLEDIKVVTTLDGSIDKDDLRSFMGYLSIHGTKYDDFDLEAFGIDPRMYHVEKAYLYYLNGFNFLLMQEKLMGMRNWYIYTAPAKHGRGSEIENDGDKPKQLPGA